MANNIARWEQLFLEQTQLIDQKETPIASFCNTCQHHTCQKTTPREWYKIHCRSCQLVYAKLVADLPDE